MTEATPVHLPVAEPPPEIPPDWRDVWHERAGIREHDGELVHQLWGEEDASMTEPHRVLIMVLSERLSVDNNVHLSGWLGRAQVVAFEGEPDKLGQPTWRVYVQEPRHPRRGRRAEPPAPTFPP